MNTLHIEHPVTDFDLWSAAFGRFAAIRRDAGVRAERISRPADDARYVVVDLDFDTLDAAQAFLQFLTAKVWAVQENAPALSGTPHTKILQPVPAPGVPDPTVETPFKPHLPPYGRDETAPALSPTGT